MIGDFMHFVKVKNILSNNNGINIYRGCTHGCIYCDSRSNCYQMNHLFEDIEIKENSVELLENKLKSKKNKCMIGTGSMTDPYLPLENKIKLTRKCLEIIDKYGFGVSIITKSDKILNDLDLLKSINKKSKCIVQMTLTTYDESLCRIIEPNVCSTKKRFETLKILNDNGIKTIVWLCPFLPYINDTKENLEGLLNYCLEAKVYGIIFFGIGLTLRDGNREYFYKKLDEKFLNVKNKYIKRYGNSYSIISDNNKQLEKIFYDFCHKNNIICNNDFLFKYMNTYEDNKEQLSFFDDNNNI